jgi:hypothetical protein
MTKEEHRELVIQQIATMLRETPFTVEYKAKKKPQGIRVIFEVTEEQMQKLGLRSCWKGDGSDSLNNDVQ